ncbi:PREDICTED: sodium/potassium-transporting ATPase subunit gamma isoform X1 [Myotis brandtii]|uniref:sodium/potassium-transporting ATPase subunit gamma isoform X1 n=1 Tax=Myotis brandtii TaxID=109478 RepID=UPI0007043F96|nr:PREDICTED: sodium/potassium-transporting ATPase subunit gamma isoform X1 [Myotis brandtii]
MTSGLLGLPKSTHCPQGGPQAAVPYRGLLATDGALRQGCQGEGRLGWRNEVRLRAPQMPRVPPLATSSPSLSWHLLVPVTLAGTWQPGGSGCGPGPWAEGRVGCRVPCSGSQLPPSLSPHVAPGPPAPPPPPRLAQVRLPASPSSLAPLFLPAGWLRCGGRDAQAISHRHSRPFLRDTAAPPWAGGSWVAAPGGTWTRSTTAKDSAAGAERSIGRAQTRSCDGRTCQAAATAGLCPWLGQALGLKGAPGFVETLDGPPPPSAASS